MMNAKELLTSRRSVRNFTSQAVDKKMLEEIVSVAKYAPSWKNTQSVRYMAILDPKVRERIAETCVLGFDLNQKTIRNAPALVLLTTVNKRSGYERDGSPSTSKGSHWQSFDAGVAAQTFCLAAHLNGLGSVIMGIFDEQRLKELVSVPDGESISAMIAIGYPERIPAAPKRKETEQLLRVIEDA